EHIPAPRGREARIARGVDRPAAVRKRADASRTLEDDVRVEALRERERRSEAVLLHPGGRGAEEARRLCRMRGEDGRTLALVAQRPLKPLVEGDRIEGVGVEHERRGSRDERGKRRALEERGGGRRRR